MKVLIFALFLVFFYASTVLSSSDIGNYLKDIDIKYHDSGLKNVDCVYVINLKKRPEKWIDIRDELENYGIHPNRVNAIDGWMFSKKIKQILSGTYPVRLRGGQIGCLLSHLSVLKDAYRRSYEVIWVCEDDIQVCENPHQISDFIARLSKIDSEWDILYTDSDSKNQEGEIIPSLATDFRPDYSSIHHSNFIKRESIDKDILKIKQRFGTYSMLVSKNGINKILKYFKHRYLWTSYDIDIHYVPTIRNYCINRDIVSINYKKNSDTEFNIK